MAGNARLLAAVATCGAAFALGLGCSESPLVTAERLAAADEPLRQRLARRTDGFERERDGVTSPGWRSARSGRYVHLGARLPERADGPLEVGIGQGESVRVKLALDGARAVPVQLENGRATYRELMPSTDALVVTAPQYVEQLLLLRDAAAPSEFHWRVTAPLVARQETDGLHFLDDQGVVRLRVPTPYLIDASGTRRNVPLAWRADGLTIRIPTEGLAYPVLVDPSWEVVSGSTSPARREAAIAVLGDGTVVVCGGTVDGVNPLPDCDGYDPSSGVWRAMPSLSVARQQATATLLPSNTLLACGGGTSSCEQLVAGSWQSAHAMAVSRLGATATLLPGGKVLMAGGDPGGATEVYDPSLDSWAPSGAAVPQAGAAAALLGNGRVLVAGGQVNGTPVASAATYDPSTNSWTAAPDMPGARVKHSATRLRDGRVLVIGGTDGAGTSGEAFAFDELTRGWSARASLVPRQEHAAILLPSGHLAAIGGHADAEAPVRAVELYDPASDHWSQGLPLADDAPSVLAALLPSGDVAAVGGFGSTTFSVRRYDVSPDWSIGPALIEARAGHTTTVLANGDILVAGGLSYVGATVIALSSAERFSSSTGVWVSVGSLSQKRGRHAAMPLATGQVLVAGGDDATGPLASAELFDPASNTWTQTGAMASAREFHTLSALPGGLQALAAGGTGTSGTLASSEVYDVASGQWTPCGSMTTARARASATLLVTGKVLVAGGAAGHELASAELFDPVASTWSNAASMSQGRFWHGAITLNATNEVLVAGGATWTSSVASAEAYDPAADVWHLLGPLSMGRDALGLVALGDGRILAVGGLGLPTAIPTSEVFDPITRAWSATSTMRIARAWPGVVRTADGRVMAVGGSAGGAAIGSTEIYDPGLSGWRAGADLPGLRAAHEAKLLPDGRVLLTGGTDGHIEVASVWTYDPSGNTWAPAADMNEARAEHSVTLLPSGEVLVAGGYTGSDYVASAEIYNARANAWRSVAPMSSVRARHSATLLPSGRVLVTGGLGYGHLDSAEVYDPAADSWSPAAPMSAPHSFHTATLLPSGKVLVAGGEGDPLGTSRVTELYDPQANSWASAGLLATKRLRHTATLLPSGEVLVAGGIADSSMPYPAVAELYDPIANTWSTTAPMTQPGAFRRAVLLPSGKVMFAGGTYNSGFSWFTVASTELYDRALQRFAGIGSLVQARDGHSLTLLADGRVLAAGGLDQAGSWLATSELGSVGLGYDEQWRPAIDSAPVTVAPGEALTLGGSGFHGPCEAGSGTSAGAATNHPTAYWLPVEGGLPRWLAPTSWTDHIVTIMAPADQPPGHVLVGVTVAGVPSRSLILRVGPPLPRGAPCSSAQDCASGFCADSVCCESACNATCERCEADGVCAPLVAGTDPEQECLGMGTCGAGTCNGARGCTFPGADIHCGLCAACDGTGGCATKPDDDPACGPVACSSLNTPCRSYQNLTANRCAALGECVEPNPTTCTVFINASDGTICTCSGAAGACLAGECVCPQQDGGTDAGTDGGNDSGVDSGTDGGGDAGHDSSCCDGSGDALVGADDARPGQDAAVGWPIATLCGCHAGANGHSPLLLVFLLAVALRARRRRS